MSLELFAMLINLEYRNTVHVIYSTNSANKTLRIFTITPLFAKHFRNRIQISVVLSILVILISYTLHVSIKRKGYIGGEKAKTV